MANKLKDILQSINGTELRYCIESIAKMAGLAKTSTDGNTEGTLVANLTGNVTGNLTGDVTGDINGRGSALTEHGAGAIGTAFAPRTYRWNKDGHIITEIHVDLTGLGVVGTAADDVIGLAAGGVAYIGRYVTATNGIVYKAELEVLETPGEGTATITTDINVTMNSSALLEYDGAASNSYLFNTGGLTAGNTIQNLTPALTANDYIYLTEGDTAATTGVYNAGQIIIRLYGHALIS